MSMRSRGGALKRRGILAATGAVVAGIVAKYAAQPVAAVAGASDGGALVIGANDIFGALPRSKNTAANPTQLTNNSGTVTSSPTSFFHQGAGLIVAASDGAEGIMGFANGPFGVGVWGVSNRGRAVYGELTGSGGADGGKAVSGDALSNTNAFGIYGTASSASSVGVYGQGSQGIGVKGESTIGTGVQGTSTSGIGVYGQSTSNHGSGGTSAAAGFSGLFGFTAVPGAAALLGVNGAVNGTAGYFHGAVFVDGSFQVVNGPKNALVAHPDGSHRRMYCQESPEPWFEDFGTAQLQGGKATVRLDPDFAAVVKADDYEVFPVPKGECRGLYVANQTPTSFEVRELQGGTSSIPFGYRLVARRKDDVGRRMEKVELPRFDLTDPATHGTPPGQTGRPPR